MGRKKFFEDLRTIHKIELTKQQYNAIINTEGYNLLLACPGSGKTTVIVIKTAYLINVLGILPYQILTLTFTKAAAQDMQKRYKGLFPNSELKPQFSTIHGFCYKIMHYYFKLQGIKKKNLEGKKNKVIELIYEKYFNKKPITEHIEEIANVISYIKNLMLNINNLDYQSFNIKYLKEIYEDYENYKEEKNFYDYDDMLIIAYRILLKDSNLLNKLRNQFIYIQVDEAQDNSKIQNEILRLLVHKKNNLFIVADDDQTIYEWRGAYPDGILKFKEKYSGSNIYKMEQNFRSSKNIVEVSNIFIQKNKNRFNKNLITNNPYYTTIDILYNYPLENQYDYAIKLIKNNSNSLSSYAFLFRNNMSSIIAAYKLNEEKINYCLKGNSGFFLNHWIVSDIKNFLLYSIKNELDNFQHIYYKNNAFISKKEFELGKQNISKKRNIIDSIYYYSNLNDYKKNKLLDLKRKFKKLSKLHINKAIPFIQNELGYEQWIKNGENKLGISIEGVRNIFKILKYIANESKDIYDYLEKINVLEEILNIKEKNSSNASVTLSTIHASKGLEFDTVFLIDLDFGVFPTLDAFDNIKKLEAERRLFYVGMTRAKYNLFLMSSSNIKEKTSIFVHEVEDIINLEH